MNLYATYYQDTTNHYHSSSIDDNELDYSTDSNTQKIVVNVINDKSSSTNSSKPTPKSTITKKGIYTSSDTVIGSQNMEDLFQVISDQRSKSSRSTSMIKHVIIIDRHDSDSLNNNQKKTNYRHLKSIHQHPEQLILFRLYLQQDIWYNSRLITILNNSYQVKQQHPILQMRIIFIHLYTINID